MSKILLAIVIILIIIAGGVYFFMQPKANTANISAGTGQTPQQNQQTSAVNDFKEMQIEILKDGTGEGAKSGDTVTVNYVGTLQDGTKFDSSIDRGTPFQFTLGQNRVIQGWELGVLAMKTGEKRKLTIPPELGYGPNGFPPVIPPNATLIFEIDLLKIN